MFWGNYGSMFFDVGRRAVPAYRRQVGSESESCHFVGLGSLRSYNVGVAQLVRAQDS